MPIPPLCGCLVDYWFYQHLVYFCWSSSVYFYITVVDCVKSDVIIIGIRYPLTFFGDELFQASTEKFKYVRLLSVAITIPPQ